MGLGVVEGLESNATLCLKFVSAGLSCDGSLEFSSTCEGTVGLDVTLIESIENLARSRKFFRLSGLSDFRV